jgi:hypothetical protein
MGIVFYFLKQVEQLLILEWYSMILNIYTILYLQ